MTPRRQVQPFLSGTNEKQSESGAHTQEENQIGGHLSASLSTYPPQTETQDVFWPYLNHHS